MRSEGGVGAAQQQNLPPREQCELSDRSQSLGGCSLNSAQSTVLCELPGGPQPTRTWLVGLAAPLTTEALELPKGTLQSGYHGSGRYLPSGDAPSLDDAASP